MILILILIKRLKAIIKNKSPHQKVSTFSVGYRLTSLIVTKFLFSCFICFSTWVSSNCFLSNQMFLSDWLLQAPGSQMPELALFKQSMFWMFMCTIFISTSFLFKIIPSSDTAPDDCNCANNAHSCCNHIVFLLSVIFLLYIYLSGPTYSSLLNPKTGAKTTGKTISPNA